MKNFLFISNRKTLFSTINDDSRYEIRFIEKPLECALEDEVCRGKTDIIVYDLLTERKKCKRELHKIVKQKIKKLIILENAKILYQGNTTPPFSVYQRFSPQHWKSQDLIQCEEIIKRSTLDFAIFRVSEIYGPNVDFGIIYNLLKNQKVSVFGGERDFLYEADFIHAIEIAIKNNATGIFDVAYGKSENMETVVDLIKVLKNQEIQIKWKSKKETLQYNCENFKFYKWQPLVNLTTGLRAIKVSKNFKI